MPPDCPHCVHAALQAKDFENLCKLLEVLLAILIEKHEVETRFLKRLMGDFEGKR
jgi:hypothetical protein